MLGLGEILTADDYRLVRPEYRRLVSRFRAVRRIRIDSAAMLVFETRETVLWHIHEILRVEGYHPRRIRQILCEVIPLLPKLGELRATVMIDGGGASRGQLIADALAVQGGLALQAGRTRCLSEPASSAVCPGDPIWYLRFCPSSEWVEQLQASCAPLTLHRAWAGEPLSQSVSNEMRHALIEDVICAGQGMPSILHRLAQEMVQHASSQESYFTASP